MIRKDEDEAMSIKDYPARLTTGYYRVRETWDDAASQLGAFRLLANAMAKADANPGYFVFSNEGGSHLSGAGVRHGGNRGPVRDTVSC
ncbi:MAG: hypothetical protein ACLTPC_07105 [Lacrimispora saccharolytica]